MTRTRRTIEFSRRRFITLLAAGSAALAAPMRAIAGANATPGMPKRASTGATKGSPGAPKPVPIDARVEKGLNDQKTSLAGTLKSIREFELPPGSEQGFAFRPLTARRTK